MADFYRVKNVRLYNFDFHDAAAIGTCSHCFKPPATDSDGRTVKFTNVTVDEATVTKKIRYQFPYKTIIMDEDGAFTGQGAGSWAISNTWSHNIWDNECWEDPIYDGLLCANTVTIRRVLFFNFEPGNLADLEMCVLKYDFA